MNLSIVIPYYNRPEYLSHALLSIYFMNCHAERFEIVIVDDHSNDDLKAMHVVRKFGNRMNFKVLYRPEKKGMNAGVVRNIGARSAQGDIILFQDCEMLHMTSIVNQTIGYFLYGEKYAVFPSLYSLSEEKQQNVERYSCFGADPILKLRKNTACLSVPADRDGQDGWYVHSVHRPEFVCGLFAMRKDQFMEMGGFDEDFFQYWGREDSDLSNRLRLRGLPRIFRDDMLSFHQHHYDPNDLQDRLTRRAGWDYHEKIWEEKKDRTDWVANKGRDWGVL